MAMLSVNKMHMEFDQIVARSINSSLEDIAQGILKEYMKNTGSLATNALLSSSLLGNPLGFVRSVRESASAISHPPRELSSSKHTISAADHVILSTAKLVGTTVGGVVGMASNVTSSLAGGVSKLILNDKKHQKDQIESRRDKPKNVLHGFTRGATSIGKGFLSAVTGLVTQPVKGGQASGASGAAVGLVSALANVPTKVVAATLDGLTNVADGVASNIAGSPDTNIIYRNPNRVIQILPCHLMNVESKPR
uniref:Vacuolar protein sorting-associated protein 13C n=1 Tax=Lygus hesperus TaxID=30085 RepID=A0A0A9ZAL3_LYGHE